MGVRKSMMDNRYSGVIVSYVEAQPILCRIQLHEGY